MADKRERLGLAIAALGIVVCALIAALALRGMGGAAPDDALSARLAAAAQAPEGTVVRVADLTDYEWERMHVFGPYTSAQHIYDELGVDWASSAIEEIQVNEGVTLLVFVQGDAVVGHALHSRGQGDLAYLDGAGPFTPGTAVFEIRAGDSRGDPWRTFYLLDAPAEAVDER